MSSYDVPFFPALRTVLRPIPSFALLLCDRRVCFVTRLPQRKVSKKEEPPMSLFFPYLLERIEFDEGIFHSLPCFNSVPAT